jgi:hypothetical protein
MNATSPFIFISILLLFLVPSHALSFIPVHDADLVQDSDLIVIGRSTSSRPERGTTIYDLQIEEILKGSSENNADAHTLSVHILGGYDQESNATLEIPGAPDLSNPQELLLLFLIRDGEKWSISKFSTLKSHSF